jgi:hypothetical protein
MHNCGIALTILGPVNSTRLSARFYQVYMQAKMRFRWCYMVTKSIHGGTHTELQKRRGTRGTVSKLTRTFDKTTQEVQARA